METRNLKLEQALGLIGLCVRAGQGTFGEDGCVTAIRSKKAALVLVDVSASDNAKKRYQDSCRHYGVPLAMMPPDTIAAATGRSGRMAMAVKPGKLAQRLKELLANQIMVLS